MNTKVLITIQNPKERATALGVGCEILAEYPDSLLARCDDAQLTALQAARLEVTPLPEPMMQIAGMSFSMGVARAADAAQPLLPDPNRRAYYLVELIGPAKAEWLKTLEALGGVIQSNFAGFTLLVGILPTQVATLQAEPWVESVTPYRPSMKVSPKLQVSAGRAPGAADLAALAVAPEAAHTPQQVEIAVFAGESTANLAAQIRQRGGMVLGESTQKIIAVIPPAQIVALANETAVQAIVPHRFPKLHNDRAHAIMAVPANQTFGDLTLAGTGQIVAIADSGLDTGLPATIHADFAGRIESMISMPVQPGLTPYITSAPGSDDGPADVNSGHGTHVAGSVLGSGAAALALADPTIPKGTAPEARVVFQAVEQTVTWKTAAQLIADGIPPSDIPPDWPPDAVGLYGLPDDLNDLFTAPYGAGARIHTNSWGSDDAGLYTDNARAVDEFMWNHRDMLILFSAGNEGVDRNADGFIDDDSIGSPGTAKNCLTVGATENNRPHGSTPPPGLDRNWNELGHYDDAGHFIPAWPALGAASHVSDNSEGMAAFSSHGPTDDGRIKPDVVAPGTNILSVRSQAYPPPPTNPEPLWGDLVAGHALRGQYCWCGGTSMSTPLVAGAAALIRQHLTQQRGHLQPGVKPSGALIKAFMINGAVPIHGQFANEIPDGPNQVAGFGRVNVTQALTPGALGMALFADEPDYAVASGEMRTFTIQPIDATQPLKVTLVWTDAPGAVGGGVLQNRLYLQVVRADGVIVDGDTSAYPTVTNNVQQVVIAAPPAGEYTIRVRGVSVLTNAPSVVVGPAPRQDFALVVANGMGLSLQPVSIAQALDTTGSMDYFGYMTPAKERAGQFVDFMRSNDKVSITEFSARGGGVPLARTPYALRLLGQFTPDWSDAHAAIAALHADGMTPIGAGLQEAWNQLHGEPTSRPRAIVLLSDGFHNYDPAPLAVLPSIPNDVPIFTIALGPASNVPELQMIANSRPNGAYFAVESDEDIHKLHQIYAQVQALAAGSALVGLLSARLEHGSAAKHAMMVEAGVKELTFTLSWDRIPGAEGLRLTVIDPKGNAVSDKTFATELRNGSTYCMVRVAAPMAGTWSLQVKHLGGVSQPYTLSGAVRSPLALTLEPVKLTPDRLLLTARLQRGQKPWDDAKLVARLTIPTRSYEQIMAEFGNQIKEIQLSETVAEPEFNEAQRLLLKLDCFAHTFAGKPEGLYGRKVVEIALQAQGNGIWSGDLPLVPGNIAVEVVGKGVIDGVAWQRTATQSIHVPQTVGAAPKLTIDEIFLRRSSSWQYVIVGVRVLKADGAVATPRDGVAVEVTASQGRKRLASGPLPFYAAGGYFIWRVTPAGWQPAPVTLVAEAKLNGVVAATARKQLRQFITVPA